MSGMPRDENWYHVRPPPELTVAVTEAEGCQPKRRVVALPDARALADQIRGPAHGRGPIRLARGLPQPTETGR